MADRLVVIVGETAGGKSALAMELAGKFNGEVICADSRTVYKGMDIGTAKPSLKDQQLVPHHLLDIVEPDEEFTAAQFKKLANAKIQEITERAKLPIMVGGTGLYIDGLLYDFGFEKDLDRKALRPNTLILGITVNRGALKERLTRRVKQMLKDGLEEEVRGLADKFGWSVKPMTGIGYREFQPYFANLQGLKETADQIERDTNLYAKRQRTWFKRNESIHWLNDPRKAIDLVTTFLNKKT